MRDSCIMNTYQRTYSRKAKGFTMARSIVQNVKTKNFTFRITEEMSKDMAEVNAKAKQNGLRINMTEALTQALEKEIKAVQKHIQKLDPTWIPGQLDLLDNNDTEANAKSNTKESAKAHTK